MKQMKVEILKKNRKYFAIKMENGFECKLLIDSSSENLEVGNHELMVEDISIRTKYGTDVIYKMAGEVKKSAKIITLQHRYNLVLVEKCRELAGRFDEASKVWVFNELVENEIEELDDLYNSDEIVVDIEAKTDLSEWHNSIAFAGYPLARAFGRDSGAKLCTDVIQLEGDISSGGSVKNWRTLCSEGAKFRIKIGRKLLESNREEMSKNWDIHIIGE